MTSGLVAVLIGSLTSIIPTVSVSSPAAASSPLDCSAVYSVQGASPRNLRSVDTTNGTVSNVGSFNISGATQSINGLGLSRDGSAAYGVLPANSGTGRTIYKLTRSNDATTALGAGVAGAGVTHGAINPVNGHYYYGGFTGNTLNVYGFNTQTNQSMGLVATGTIPTDGANGDWSFDAQGRLYVVGGVNGQNTLSVVNQQIPTSGTITITGTRVSQFTTGTDPMNGIAFGSDGYLHLSGGSRLYKVNPSTGATVSELPMSQAGSTDLASCASPNTIAVQKNFSNGRVNNSDQASLSVTGGGISTGNTGTTTGTDSGLQDQPGEIAGPVFGLSGTTYTVSESGAGSSTPNYDRSWKCVDENSGNTLASGTGTSGSFTMPNGGAKGVAAVCTFTNAAQIPKISLTKSAANPVDANNSGRIDAGDTIAYSFVVTNTGTTTLQRPTINDPKLGTVTCPAGNLAPGAKVTCTASAPYTITQADVDAGTVTNTATVTGTPTASGLPTVTASDSSSTSIRADGALSLDKSAGAPTDANNNGRIDAGDTIAYTFTVKNTGNTTMRQVAVADPKVGAVSCSTTTLAPGASTTCTKTYSITQADVDAGSVQNTASASGQNPSGTTATSSPDSTATPITAANALSLDKSAGAPVDANSNGRIDAGDTIAYSFAVRNTGNTTLRQVSIADPKAGAVSCSTTTLAPNASTTCTKTYTITQADVDAGSVQNTASASGQNPSGTTITSPTDSTATAIAAGSALTLRKSAGTPTDVNGNGRVDAGDTIAYSFAITNSGNTTVTNLAVNDAKTGGATCSVSSLSPGASTTCTKNYTITQADVDAGSVQNTATVSGRSPSGGSVTSPSDSTSTPTSTSASLTVDKSVDATHDVDGNGTLTAGDTIDYSFVVSNTGDRTLSAVRVADPKVGSVECANSSLAPRASTTCTATYTVTQADVDAGAVQNTATASADDPSGAARTSDPDSTSTPTSTDSRLELAKDAADPVDANDSGEIDAGDTIAYTFTAHNTGSVTLNSLTVDDPKITSVSCADTTLAPDATTTCTGTYTLTQADVDRGIIENRATASAQTAGGTEVSSNTATETSTITGRDELALDKTIQNTVDENANGRLDAGDTIRYAFTSTNSGTRSMSFLGIDDPHAPGATCPATTLAPGESTQCVGSYTVTQADVDAGGVTNTARAVAENPMGDDIQSPSDTTSIETSAVAEIVLDKSVTGTSDENSNDRLDAGDTISYEFVVRNSGAVSLTGVEVTDPKAGNVDCPETSLAPGASTTCTATYTITQDDVDSGSVDNTATAAGSGPSGSAVESDPDSTSTALDTTATLSFDKSVAGTSDENSNDRLDAGDTISYEFAVTNDGSRSVRRVTVTDPKVGTVTCPNTRLAPGASVTCTATYTLTQADVDTGSVDNTAHANAIDPSGNGVESPTDTTSTALDSTATLELDKSVAGTSDENSNDRLDAGDTISFEFEVTNTGSVTIGELAVSDPKVGDVECPETSLAPNASTTCTATYTITQDDVDAGSVENTATAGGEDPSGNSVESDEDSTSTALDTTATLSMDKSVAGTSDENSNDRLDAGDTISYEFEVTNTGSRTISSVAIADPKVGDVDCPTTTLAPNASTTCTATYTITQDDVDAGSVDNTATGTGEDPSGTGVESDEDSTSTALDTTATLSFDKSVAGTSDENGNDRLDAGDTISYEFEVTNTGARTISDVAIVDPKVGDVDCPTTSLAPNASTTCTATYTVTQDDVDAGGVENTAHATGTDPSGADVESPDDSTSTDTDATATLSMDKSVAATSDENSNDRLDAGDTISYEFAVTNTGSVTISSVAIADPKVGNVDCPETTLAPNASTTCTATYTVTQDDVDSGSVDNTATAGGEDPSGNSVESDEDSTSTALDTTATLSFDKSVAGTSDENSNDRLDAGDTISYEFEVTNTGSRTISDVAIVDPKIGDVDCAETTLAPNASTTCTATYTVTQADVDAGGVENTAHATGSDPSGSDVESPDDSTSTETDATATLAMDKSVAGTSDENSNDRLDAGDTISYEFAVTNTGSVTISSVAIVDPKVGDVDCPETTLAPNASTTCTATYTITQDDVDSGSVDNTATATGEDPSGTGVESDEDSTSTALDTTATLSMDKSVAGTSDENSNDRLDAGDTISYEFVVTNTGARTISSVAVVDPKIGDVDCPETTLAPNASTTCTATYTVTQDDVDAGSVENTALATGSDPSGSDVESPDDSTSTETDSTATLSFDKSVASTSDENSNDRLDAGDTISYEFVVTNTGSRTISSVAVVDPKIGDVDCPETTLAPNASTTCTATYTVTQDDVDAGSVENTATATGEDPSGADVASPEDSTSTETDATATLSFDKSVASTSDENGNDRLDAGDTISYEFEVTNTGSRTISSVAVVDPKVGDVDCPATTLAPNASTTCTATYTVTQDDVDSGSVENTAHATGSDPSGADVESPDDSTSTETDTTATLSMDKSVAGTSDENSNDRLDAGDTISYEFEVTNTGARTISSVAIADPKVGDVDCPTTTLAPNASTTCTATYTITQDDVDSGSVDNTATAGGEDPSGNSVESDEDSTSTALDTTATLSMDKSVAGTSDENSNDRLDAGDTISYEFVVTNTGARTISSVAIVDPKVGDADCPETTLAPNASTTCTATYTITQDDVDSGSVENTAHATGTDPSGADIESDDDSTSTETDTTATLELDKSVADTSDENGNDRLDAGDTISYEFAVTNTGARTISSVAIVDPKIGRVDCPTTSLAPNASTTCTATYTITQDDVDSGSVENTAHATGVDPSGAGVESDDDSTSTETDATATLELDKSVAGTSDENSNDRLDAGDTISYDFVVTNTGSVTIDDVAVSDPKVGDVDCPATSLAPNTSITCTATYTITQDDVDSGSVENTAHATGNDPSDNAVESPDDSTSTETDSTATLGLVKEAGTPQDSNDSGRLDAGDTIDYTFTITNTGSRTISSIDVDDPKVGSVDCPTTRLAPNASTECTATYRLDQDDIDAGSISNTATASGSDPSGTEVTSSPDTVRTDLPAAAALTIEKRAGTPTDSNDSGRLDAGDTIDYTFTIANTGNVTVHGIAVDDPLVDTVSCPDGDTLSPGADMTCTATYTMTQADLDAGTVDNRATVSGVGPGGGDVPPDSDSTSTAIAASAGIVLDKTADLKDRDGDRRADVGEKIDYSFAVANTGTSTLTDISIVDSMLSRVGVTPDCPRTSLAPDEKMTCTATYTVRSSDLGHPLHNTAYATGHTTRGDVESSDSTATVTADDPPSSPGPGTPGPGSPGGGLGLPDTGGPAGWLLLTGLLSVLAGVGLVRRRRDA